MQGKKACGSSFSKEVLSKCNARPEPVHECDVLKGAVSANGAWQVTSILWLRANEPPSTRVRSRRWRIGMVARRRARRSWNCPNPNCDPPHYFLATRSEEYTSELQSLRHLVCRLL